MQTPFAYFLERLAKPSQRTERDWAAVVSQRTVLRVSLPTSERGGFVASMRRRWRQGCARDSSTGTPWFAMAGPGLQHWQSDALSGMALLSQLRGAHKPVRGNIQLSQCTTGITDKSDLIRPIGIKSQQFRVALQSDGEWINTVLARGLARCNPSTARSIATQLAGDRWSHHARRCWDQAPLDRACGRGAHGFFSCASSKLGGTRDVSLRAAETRSGPGVKYRAMEKRVGGKRGHVLRGGQRNAVDPTGGCVNESR